MKVPALGWSQLTQGLLIALLVAGCEAKQPESIKYVAAYSVPLKSEEERADFLSALSALATQEAMHLDASNQQELESMSSGAARMTIHAAVWKGTEDEELEASVMDVGHSGNAWITFNKGVDINAARRFRQRATQMIKQRWPGTLSLPIMPSGSIPLYEDLVETPNGYVVSPSAASKYVPKGS